MLEKSLCFEYFQFNFMQFELTGLLMVKVAASNRVFFWPRGPGFDSRCRQAQLGLSSLRKSINRLPASAGVMVGNVRLCRVAGYTVIPLTCVPRSGEMGSPLTAIPALVSTKTHKFNYCDSGNYVTSNSKEIGYYFGCVEQIYSNMRCDFRMTLLLA